MGKIKSMVVDDSKIMRSAVKRALDQLMIADFDYVEAKDGQDALEKFTDDIQIMFVDWNMPNMTGVEFARAVRDKGNTEHIPIIMVTAEKSMGKVDKALNEGASEYVTKPFTADKMYKTISRYFDDDGNLKNSNANGEEKKSFFKSILQS